MAFLPDGDLLVTERPGRLRVVRDGVLDPTPIAGMPTVRAVVIGGLADVVLHPHFARNQLIYFSYSKPDAQDPYAIDARRRARPLRRRRRAHGRRGHLRREPTGTARRWQGRTIAAAAKGRPTRSFGARMAFGRDGMLYVASGDRNWGEKAQEPSSHLGQDRPHPR